MFERNNQNDMMRPAGRAGAAGREPYQKPAFRHEQVFETMALACGKIVATISQCRTFQKNS